MPIHPAPPTQAVVTSIATDPADGTLRIGQRVLFTLTVDAPVDVTGFPTLGLSNGGVAVFAPALSTPTALVFSYVVLPGQDSTRLSVTKLVPGGGTLSVPGTIALTPGASFAAGNYAVGVAAADLNRDGRTDAVVANAFGTLQVLAGNGSGGFRTAVEYNIGRFVHDLVLADVDGDGFQDAVLDLEPGTGEALVMLGDGAGGFGPAADRTIPALVGAATLADLDGDGILDRVSFANGGMQVTIELGKAGGGFGTSTSLTAGYSITGVVVADLDRDGVADLAIADLFGPFRALHGRGDGTFGPAVEVAGVGQASGVVAVDLDGDGDQDLLVSHFNGTALSVVRNVSFAPGSVSLDSVPVAAGHVTGLAVRASPPAVTIGLQRDTGPSSTDRLTGDGALRGTAAAGAVVVIRSGAFVLATVTADQRGAWAAVPGLGLGEHRVTASVTDAAGNTGTATLDFTLLGGVVAVQVDAPPGPVRLGRTVTITLVTNAAVTVSGMPVLRLSNGGAAEFDGVAPGGMGLVFHYRVRAGEDTAELRVTGLDVVGGGVSVAAATTFSQTVSPVVGNARAIAAGDLDGDGRADLVAAAGAGGVAVLLNRGGGAFGTPTRLATGFDAYGIATGDLDGDGAVDVVAATTTGVVVLRNGGGGAFGAATAVTPDAVRDVALADLDNDGDLDIVGAVRGGNSVAVLLNDGAGGFGPGTAVASGSDPFAVIAADFNDDGAMDLAVADFSGRAVSVLLGNGRGGFLPRMQYSVPNFAIGVAAVDLNGDGALDLVVAQQVFDTAAGLTVFTGDGHGGFRAGVTSATGGFTDAVAVADIDGDGRADAVFGNQQGTVSVRHGNGTGLEAAAVFATGGAAWGITAADLDGDGRADLAVADLNGSVRVLLNRSTQGTTVEASSLAGVPGAATGIVVETGIGVVTGIGVSAAGPLGLGQELRFSVTLGAVVQAFGTPLLRLNNGGVAAYDAALSSPASLVFRYTVLAGQDVDGLAVTGLMLNGGSLGVRTGAWSEPSLIAVDNTAQMAAFADVNGDGVPDIVSAEYSGGRVAVLLGNGRGGFGAAAHFVAGGFARSVAVGDVTGDGRADLVVANESGGVRVLAGDGAGGFGAPVPYSAGALPWSAILADVTGDGRVDAVVVADDRTAVAVLEGNGTGFWPQVMLSAGAMPTGVAAADVDGDGDQDLVVADAAGQVVVLQGSFGGSFGGPVGYALGSSPAAVAVGDLDGDGVPDIAVATSSGAAVLRGLGGGVFGAATALAAGGAAGSIAIGDMDGDGRADLVLGGDGGVTLLLNDGAGGFGGPLRFSVGSVGSVAVADGRGDGRLDVVAGRIDGRVAVLTDPGYAVLAIGAASLVAAPGHLTGVVVDTIAPVVTIGLLNDTGAPGDGVTADPEFAGVTDPFGVVTLTEGPATLGTASADGTGAWRFTPTLGAGLHVVTARGTDAAGNTGTAALPFTLEAVACYCAGTLILTDGGEVAVEALRIGDRLVTASGAVRPIRWIGRRAYAARFAAANPDVQPVLIRAGALGGGVPRRDLHVSPLHGMLLDGVLVAARDLVDGVGVVAVREAREVTYFHPELDGHDVILAEGAASESFVDDGSRGLFQNVDEYRALYPDAAPGPVRWAAPRVEHGPVLEAVRRRVAAFAAGGGGGLQAQPTLRGDRGVM